MAEYLSEHFTLDEMIYSDTAKAKKINNSPTEIHKKVLKHTCQYLLEPLRALLNEKYKIYNGKKVKKVTIKVTSEEVKVRDADEDILGVKYFVNLEYQSDNVITFSIYGWRIRIFFN